MVVYRFQCFHKFAVTDFLRILCHAMVGRQGFIVACAFPQQKIAIVPSAPARFLFSHYCYFIGVPCGSLWGGERGPLLKRKAPYCS